MTVQCTNYRTKTDEQNRVWGNAFVIQQCILSLWSTPTVDYRQHKAEFTHDRTEPSQEASPTNFRIRYDSIVQAGFAAYVRGSMISLQPWHLKHHRCLPLCSSSALRRQPSAHLLYSFAHLRLRFAIPQPVKGDT
jgi:hypothetical protein